MAKHNPLLAKLASKRAALCLTYGHGYTMEPHGLPVNRKAAQALIDDAEKQWCLFAADCPSSGEHRLIPNEDGLFPGMSQTWRIEE